MPEAVSLWLDNPKALDAYLCDRGMDIGDWHRGTLNEHGAPKLSSRRLIALCEHIPELGGRWPLSLKVAAEIHRETALRRNSLYAGGEHAYPVPAYMCPPDEVRPFPDPDVVLAMVEDDPEDDELRSAVDEFYALHGLMTDEEVDSGNNAEY